MDMKEIESRIGRAAVRVVSKHPFFGSLLLQTARVYDEAIPTLQVEVRAGTLTMRVNRTFCATLSAEVLEAALAHEVMHLAMHHLTRMDGRNMRKWNFAADYVVNDILVLSGFTLGQGWPHNTAFRDMSAEQVYTKLPDPKGDGSGAGGPPGPGNDLGDGESGGGEAQQAAEEAATNAVARAAATARLSEQYGNMPDALKRMIDSVLHPKVDWRATLRRFMTDVSRNDYSWRRPNRRHLAHGVYLPSMYSEACACIAVLIDTSGSEQSDDIQRRFFSELHGVHAEARPTKTLVASFDTKVHDTFEYGPDDVLPPALALTGGGGTAFDDALRWARDKGAVAAIVLTDLYGSFGADPGIPVLWCSRSRGVGAPFGTVVEIEL